MAHLDLQSTRRLIRGQASPAEAAAWQEHLNTCRPCRELVKSEREFMGMLELDGSPLAPAAAPPAALLTRVTKTPVRRWRTMMRFLELVGAAGACVGLATLLAWQASRAMTPAEQMARELGIAPELQAQAVYNLPAIVAIKRDPWLATEYDIVIALEQLILHETEPDDAGPS